MKQDMVQARGWLLPQSIRDRLFEWFVEKETTKNSNRSQKIFVEISKLCKQYKKQEPIVQVELSLWKMACLLNPPMSNNNTTSNSSNNKASDDNFDAVDYFVRGGWKKYKSAMRHDPMIGIVMTNILPFLTNIDYETSCARADYFYLNDDISTVIVSSAGCDEVNGIYRRQYGKRFTPYDAPVFTKPGTYEGDGVTYSIYKYDCYTYPRWYISILPTGDPGEEDDIDFYYNMCDMNVPPTKNWETYEQVGGGIRPPPLIMLVKGVAL